MEFDPPFVKMVENICTHLHLGFFLVILNETEYISYHVLFSLLSMGWRLRREILALKNLKRA